MPLNVALVGLQAFHSYCPTFTMHANPLVTLPTVCNTLECFPNVVYRLQPLHSFVAIAYRLQHSPPILQISTFKYSPSSFYHVLDVTFLW
jgi:hypothetical protein